MQLSKTRVDKGPKKAVLDGQDSDASDPGHKGQSEGKQRSGGPAIGDEGRSQKAGNEEQKNRN